MSIITIINLFLLPCLITVLVTGAILNYKSIENNKYQQTLMTTFAYWALIMFYIYVKFFKNMHIIDGNLTISFVSDVCSLQVLIMGAMCFISLISYPVVILNARYLTLKNWWRRIKPTASAIFIYFVVHLITGANPFVRYASLGELFSNIGTVTVISRLGLAVAFLYFWCLDLWRIWHVVPRYNQYIQDNYADSQCNVGWIRKLVVYITAVLCAYFAMLFFCSPIVNLVYIVFLLIMFAYMVEMSLVYRTSEGLESVNIFLDPNNFKDYIFTPLENKDEKDIEPDSPATVEGQEKEPLDDALKLVNEWMDKESLYTNVNFTTNDILEAFPQFTRYDLTNLFRYRSETFQSYVRRFRIKKACELLRAKDEKAYPKKIFVVVGFSHYSSFSRAFVSMIGISPSDFVKLTDQKKDEIIVGLEEN